MHDVRLLSVKHFTFLLIYRTRGPWACISGVRIFKFLTPYPSASESAVSRRHCALYKLNLLTYLLTS